LALVVTFAVACSQKTRGPTEVKFDNDDNIRQVYAAYTKATLELGHPPTKIEDLKPFLKELGDPEQLLISPNDSLPYVIVWNADPKATAVVVHEQEGSHGMRIVIGGQGILRPPEPVFNAMRGGVPPVDRGGRRQ
jgi:hypothetical protein